MPIKYKDNVDLAVADLLNKKYTSIRGAAAAYGVNHVTLSRRYHGTHQTRRSGAEARQKLSNLQEGLLEKWILQCEASRNPVTYQSVREMASLITTNGQSTTTIGKNWISRFLQRRDALKSKLTRKIDYQRLDGTRPKDLRAWYDGLRAIIRRYHIAKEEVYNMDETGVAIGDCSNGRTLGSSKTSTAWRRIPANREWVTIIETISIDGRRLKPVVIFKGKSLQTTWFPAKVPDYWYTTTSNAWTSNELCLQWLEKVFLNQNRPRRGKYQLLLLDNHGSHITTDFMAKCFQNDIICYYLLPHSSHVCQPLDISCFSSVKSHYRTRLAKLAAVTDSTPVHKDQFIELYAEATEEAFIPRIIKNGFSGSGIEPWDPEKAITSGLVVEDNSGEQIRPQTPTQRAQNGSIDAAEASEGFPIKTPANRKDFEASLQSIRRQEGLSRNVRLLCSKTAKAIDALQYEVVDQRQRLHLQSQKLEILTKKKPRRKAIDSNIEFANIEQIIAARTQAATNKADYIAKHPLHELQKVSEEAVEAGLSSHLFEWQI